MGFKTGRPKGGTNREKSFHSTPNHQPLEKLVEMQRTGQIPERCTGYQITKGLKQLAASERGPLLKELIAQHLTEAVESFFEHAKQQDEREKIAALAEGRAPDPEKVYGVYVVGRTRDLVPFLDHLARVCDIPDFRRAMARRDPQSTDIRVLNADGLGLSVRINEGGQTPEISPAPEVARTEQPPVLEID